MNKYASSPTGTAPQKSDTRRRREIVAEILDAEKIGSQEELRERLRTNGIEVSQASLSRDLKAMAVSRMHLATGGFAYALPSEIPAATSKRSFATRFSTSATGVRRSGFVVLVFSPPGEGQLIGRLLDQGILPGLLGTVAGDDTVILITEGEEAAANIEKELSALIG